MISFFVFEYNFVACVTGITFLIIWVIVFLKLKLQSILCNLFFFEQIRKKITIYLEVFKSNIDLMILMYTTKITRLSVLILPPIFTVLFVQLNNKMYDYDKLTLQQSFYFVATGVLTIVFMNGISGIFTYYLTDYRMKELIYELEITQITLGTYLSTSNKKRLEKAIKNVWQLTNIYFIPINLYKSTISIVGSLIIIDGIYFKIGLVLIYLCVFLISNMFSKYTIDKQVKDTVFDPYSKNGYEEEKTKEEINPENIITLENTKEVFSRLTFGHTIVNDIDSKMENETKRSIKYAFRNTLIDATGVVIFVFLLNVTSRSVAQSASSLCWIISIAFSSFDKWKKVYYLQEHMHILKKLACHTHQSPVRLQYNCQNVLNVNKITFKNVSFEYNSDILTEKSYDDIAELAIKNLSCTFTNKKLNYITGENGGGKSSLLKALLYNIKSGSIFFDDINRNNIDWITLRRSIYYLNQSNEHPVLLSETILKQLKNNNSTLAEKMGLNDLTDVSGDTKSASGGQEQRIHIFTALTSNANIILLDEPFSALDIEWKDTIENILIEIAKTKIIIMIGHDCFKGKESKIMTYSIVNYKKSLTDNTQLINCSTCEV